MIRLCNIVTAVLLFFLLSLPDVSSADDPERLRRNEGYLLLELDLERYVSEIVLSTDGFRKKDRRVRRVGPPEKLNFGPYQPGRRFVFYRLNAGRYSIKSIDVPHFDLPYRLDRSDDERWHFDIVKNEVNYLGRVIVRRERGSDSVNVRLVNRIAESQAAIKAVRTGEAQDLPLRYAGLLRDSFFEVYFPPESAEQ